MKKKRKKPYPPAPTRADIRLPGAKAAVDAWLNVEGQAGTIGSDADPIGPDADPIGSATDVLGMYTGIPYTEPGHKMSRPVQDADDL